MARLNTLFRNIRVTEGLSVFEMADLCSISPEEVYRLESTEEALPRRLLDTLSDVYRFDIHMILDEDVEFLPAKYLITDIFMHGNYSRVHDVYCLGLKNGALLHRYSLKSGEKYSAIYVANKEYYPSLRKEEISLILQWQCYLADSEFNEGIFRKFY